MKTNYHSHTPRCKHARGSEREYVEEAIKSGFKVWGFSDHSVYPFPNGYQSNIRMSTSEFEDYVDTVVKLKKEYSDDIEIHLGLEAEYYPLYFNDLLELIKDYPVEYLIMGQHFIGNEPVGIYSGAPSDDISIITAYADQVIEGLRTGKFSYLAHPELINYTGNDQQAAGEQMRRICRCAKELNIPLEVNFLGLIEKRQYPRADFWKIAGEEGCKAIFGIDAHDLEAIRWPEVIYEPALSLIRSNGVELVETLEFRSLF